MLDGVYIDGQFSPLPQPNEDELIRIASEVSRKVLAHIGDEDGIEPEDDSVMPHLIAASAQGKIALGCQQDHGQMRLVGHEPQGMAAKARRYRDGKLMYKLKRRFADGTEAVVVEPLDLISRLCAPAPQKDEDPRVQLNFFDNDPLGHQ